MQMRGLTANFRSRTCTRVRQALVDSCSEGGYGRDSSRPMLVPKLRTGQLPINSLFMYIYSV